MNVSMLRCQEVEDALGAYALDALDADESEAVAAHLVVCPRCQESAHRAAAVVDALATLVPPVEPPPDLKSRLLAGAGPSKVPAVPPAPIPIDRKRRSLVPVFLGAVAAVLVLGIAVLAVALSRVTDERDDAIASAQLLSSYVSEGGQVIPLANQNASIYKGYAATGSLVIAPGKDPLVVVSGCPKSSENLTYRVWFAREGERSPAGELWVDEDGSGILRLQPDEPITEFDTVGVTALLSEDQREDVLVGEIAMITD